MARIWLVLGVLIISFSAIFVRLAAVTPTTAAFFRALYALPLLLLIRFYIGHDPAYSPRARLMALLSGCFLGFDLTFWHWAIELIGAGLSTVLSNTQVVFVGLLAWWFYHERPRRAALVAGPVVFAGVFLISGLGSSDAYGANPGLGAVFGILTGITYSIFLLVFRAAGRGLRSPVAPLFDATVGAAIGVLITAPFGALPEIAWRWPAHGWLLLLAAGPQVVGWLLIGAALPRLPALESSVALLGQPMLTVVWAWMLFAERISVIQACGIALVLGGVSWLSVGGGAAQKKQVRTGPENS